MVYNNRNWGIFWELSYGGARIHHNILTDNGVGDGTANWGANTQLLISCSDGSVGPGIEIYENTIDGAAYPLGLINHSSHPLRTRQVYVHHNDFTMRISTTQGGSRRVQRTDRALQRSGQQSLRSQHLPGAGSRRRVLGLERPDPHVGPMARFRSRREWDPEAGVARTRMHTARRTPDILAVDCKSTLLGGCSHRHLLAAPAAREDPHAVRGTRDTSSSSRTASPRSRAAMVAGTFWTLVVALSLVACEPSQGRRRGLPLHPRTAREWMSLPGRQPPVTDRRQSAEDDVLFRLWPLSPLRHDLHRGAGFPHFDLRAAPSSTARAVSFIGIDGPDAPDESTRHGRPGWRLSTLREREFPHWVQPLVVRGNGLVVGTELRNNFNMGLTVQGDNARIVRVHTHHNGRYGVNVTPPCIGCPGPSNVIIEDSEIAFNNTRTLPIGDDAGGTKFVHSDGMIVRGNEIHDNYGAGLWWDGFNTDARVHDNVIYDNRNWGIFWELSYGGTRIYDNTLTDNGVGDGVTSETAWFANVQLLVSASDGGIGTGIEIYGNTIDGTANPLGIINHGSHPLRTREVHIHHNDITLRAETTRVGAAAFDGLIELFSSEANNRFDHNTYHVPDLSGAYWEWNGRALTWEQWQSSGHDVSGSLLPGS